MTRELKPYQRRALDHLCSRKRLDNLDVLEIGGDLTFATAGALLERGARSVTSINVAFPFTSRQVSAGIRAIRMDARFLGFDGASFDLAVGIAVLEHLPNLEIVLKNLADVLKIGGLAFLRGAPIWTSSAGHHLWVTCADGATYHFSGNNPVPPWGHLLYSEKELGTLLRCKGLADHHAAKICEWVYHSEHINRYGIHDLQRVLEQSGFKVVELTKSADKAPDPQTKRRLREVTGLEPNLFKYRGISVILGKP